MIFSEAVDMSESRFDYITEILDQAVEDARPIDVKGKVIQVVGTIIKASVPGVKMGDEKPNFAAMNGINGFKNPPYTSQTKWAKLSHIIALLPF